MSGKLDLSSLPPEVRQKVEAGLQRLSPEARRQWETKGSPLLAKLVAGLAGTGALLQAPPPLPPSGKALSARRLPSAPSRSATHPTPYRAPEPVAPVRDETHGPAQVIRRTPPHGHYNDTIAPGDKPGMLQRVLLGAVIAGVAVWLFR